MTRREQLFFAKQHGATAIEFIRCVERGEINKDFRLDEESVGELSTERAAHAFAVLAARHARAYVRLREARANRRARADVYASLGMKKVRGALGGIYYE